MNFGTGVKHNVSFRPDVLFGGLVIPEKQNKKKNEIKIETKTSTILFLESRWGEMTTLHLHW